MKWIIVLLLLISCTNNTEDMGLFLFNASLQGGVDSAPPIVYPIVEANDATTTHAINHLDIPTSDGSGQNVHPSIVIAPNGISWNGYKYWLSTTPYPYSDVELENPEVIASNDGVTWVVPDGLTNPIYDWTGVGHNSDSDLMFYNNRLYCYFNGRHDVAPIEIGHFVMSSSDGIDWGTYDLVSNKLISGSGGFSPAVLEESDGTFSLWNVTTYDNIRNLRRFKCDTPDGVFGEEQICTVNNLPINKAMYHLDINKYGDKYHGLFTMGTAPSGGSNTSIWFATSDDGITWECSDTVLLEKNTSSSWQDGQIYRSSMLYEPDTHTYKLYYSALAVSGTWYTGLTTINL